MTTVRRWRNLPPVTRVLFRLGTALVMALVTILALVIALYAANQSGNTAACVNDALGGRNGLQQSDAKANAANTAALRDVLQTLSDAYEGKASREEMAAASKRGAAALSSGSAQLVRNAAKRAAAPLGRC